MEIDSKFENALKILQDDRNSQLFLETRRKHIKLAPKYLGNVKVGISQQLTASLSHQDKNFDGFPLAYSNVKIVQSSGKLISDQTCIHVDVQADFIVFKPTVGCKLIGQINKISKRHLGCLVHGHFNAWVPQTTDTQKMAASVLMGSEIELTVKGVETSRNVLSIKGKLEKIFSSRGEKECISIHQQELSTLQKKPQKKKRKKTEDENLQDRSVENKEKGIGEEGINTLSEADDENKDKVGDKNKDNKGERCETDSGVSFEIGQGTTDNYNLDNSKHKKKKKKEKKSKGKDVSDTEGCLETANTDRCLVQDSSLISVSSFDPVFTSTQVDFENVEDNVNLFEKKKKKHKKKKHIDNGDGIPETFESEIQTERVVNGDMNDSEIANEQETTEDIRKKSRKRHHKDLSTVHQSSDLLDDSDSIAKPSSAKKKKKKLNFVQSTNHNT